MELSSSESNRSFWRDMRETMLRSLKSNQRHAQRRRPGLQRRPTALRLSSLKTPPPSKALDAFRFWILLGAIEVFTVWGGASYFGRFGAVAGCAVALGFGLFVFWWAPKSLLDRTKPQPLTQHDTWRVKKAFTAWSQVIPAAHSTQLLLSDLPAMFSISVTRSNRFGTIIMSRSLLNRLSEDELFDLVGFELAKIHSGYARAATYSVCLAGVFDWPGLRWLAAAMARFIIGTSRWTSGSSHRVFSLDEWMAECCVSRDLWSRTIFNVAEMSRGLYRTTAPSEIPLDPMCALTESLDRQYSKVSMSWYALKLMPSPRERIARLVGHYPP